MLIKALLIDPFHGEDEPMIREIEIENDLKAIYAALSHPLHPVSGIAVVRGPAGHHIFVDDEGLFKDPKYWFEVQGFPQALAGRGLVTRTDGRGETVSATIPASVLAQTVRRYVVRGKNGDR
ncbi:hypothetical protein [Paracoccus sp. MKU1]|uniref:DUF3846 domain-containing protein n=1 Tax=Paracoccus sp. MKU1 TaxID=1745182 RepID=UPI00071926CF|nr:hypothetical protein [Paracoccus sp. MKU1]KRW94330.1 hypothetical protein AQY21_20590 [Paracoccus sp. MKU1]